MQVQYLGPADRLVVDGVAIARGAIGEITKAQYDALGPKRSRVRVIRKQQPPRAPARAKSVKE